MYELPGAFCCTGSLLCLWCATPRAETDQTLSQRVKAEKAPTYTFKAKNLYEPEIKDFKSGKSFPLIQKKGTYNLFSLTSGI